MTYSRHRADFLLASTWPLEVQDLLQLLFIRISQKNSVVHDNRGIDISPSTTMNIFNDFIIVLSAGKINVNLVVFNLIICQESLRLLAPWTRTYCVQQNPIAYHSSLQLLPVSFRFSLFGFETLSKHAIPNDCNESIRLLSFSSYLLCRASATRDDGSLYEAPCGLRYRSLPMATSQSIHIPGKSSSSSYLYS